MYLNYVHFIEIAIQTLNLKYLKQIFYINIR